MKSVLKAGKSKQPNLWFRGATIPLREVRRFVREVVKQYQPDKVVLFGSYAYGTPHDESDVDLMVIMPARNEQDQAFKIRSSVPATFPLDLLVRKPANVAWRLAEQESFTTEIMKRGKVMYDKKNTRVGTQSRSRLSRRTTARS